MIYWLLKSGPDWGLRWADQQPGETQVFLTARIGLATVSAFLLALLFGPYAIAWLKTRFRERIDSASARLNELHAGKASTPTMGGIFIVAAILGAAVLFGDLTSPFVQQGMLLIAVYAMIGGIDDWIKIRTSRRGLTPRQKMIAQMVGAALITAWLNQSRPFDPNPQTILVPLVHIAIPIGSMFAAWGMLVIAGSSNAVNLTDGLDGLAAGCLIFSGACLAGLCYLAGHRLLADYLTIPYLPGSGELSVLLGALVGASLGFLWFNCYPAQVFMGDTGSLPTGALLGYAALAIHQELLLVVIGGVFVVETLSVMAQVSWFRFSGRRILACSPLHNHFLFQGQHEMKIVVRFWIASALLAVLAIASLKML